MNTPLYIEIVADGEDALRLRKRVGCAARALGIEIRVAEQSANGMPPRVMVKDSLLVEGLPRTEDIEQRLGDLLTEELT